MIKVLFFGRFSDLVDSSEGWVVDAETVKSVTDIVADIEARSPALHSEITQPQVMIAVNQQVVGPDATVADGDEVAFLPPVTGG